MLFLLPYSRYLFVIFLSFCPHGVVEEVLVGQADAVFEFGTVPAQGGGFAHVKELAGGAIRLRGIEFYRTLKSYL